MFRRSNAIRACLFGGCLFSAGISAHARPTNYFLMGPSANATDYGDPYSHYWAWNGAYLSGFVGALVDDDNFGHLAEFGYQRPTLSTSFNALNKAFLTRADGIVSPWWNDAAISSYEVSLARYHFLHGGDLLLFDDDANHDAIAADLGVPTVSSAYANAFVTGTTFPFDGPFGTVTSVHTAGIVGALSPTDIATHHGHVLAVDGSGKPIIAYWDRDEYAPGAGKMIIVTDIDMVSSYGGADFSPGGRNDNGIFGLNLVAGLLSGGNACNPADVNGDGILNLDDIAYFADAFLNGCP
ncbi:MAG: hypothetical protein R3B49_10950 [Phycisphaerales bacterium]